MSSIPPIRRGIGKLTPRVWSKFAKAADWVESNTHSGGYKSPRRKSKIIPDRVYGCIEGRCELDSFTGMDYESKLPTYSWFQVPGPTVPLDETMQQVKSLVNNTDTLICKTCDPTDSGNNTNLAAPLWYGIEAQVGDIVELAPFRFTNGEVRWKIVSSPRDYFWAQITGVLLDGNDDPVWWKNDGTYNWKYKWCEVDPTTGVPFASDTARCGGSPDQDYFDDYLDNSDYGTSGYAKNMVETWNDYLNARAQVPCKSNNNMIAPGVDMSGNGYPSQFSPQAISSCTIVKMHCVNTWVADGSGADPYTKSAFYFTAENAHDGPCAT